MRKHPRPIPVTTSMKVGRKAMTLGTPATKKARGRQGKPKGAQKFTVGDESRLLDIVNVLHPIGGDMWERVSQQRSAFKCSG
jgi:hypothetical protein